MSTIGGTMNLTRLISILHNQKNSYMNVQLKDIGLSHGQAIALKIIYEEATIKQEDLNKRLQIDKSAVTRILNTLKEKGLIIKEIAKEDKRNQMISLTEKGKVEAKFVIESFAKLENNALKDFTDEEKMQFVNFLNRVNKNLKEC